MGVSTGTTFGLMALLLVATVAPFSAALVTIPSEHGEKADWVRMSPSQMVEVDLKQSSGLLHLTSGSFDPLRDTPPSTLMPYLEASGNVVIIQLYSTDAMVLAQIADRHSLNILDHLPDEGWLLRLPSSVNIEALREEPTVRWVGIYEPQWRMSERLLKVWDEPPSKVDIGVVLAPDITQSGAMQLSEEFSRLDARRVWCGTSQCEIWGLAWDEEAILALASDERFLQLSTLSPLKALNSYAAQTIELDEVTSTWSSNLDGTGEIIAVADTGIDGDHPDFGNQILTIKTNYGLDSSSLDKNTGHGTHVVGTILGDGTGDSEAAGLAPQSLLHFQALEHDNTGYFGRQGSLYDMLRDFYVLGARTGSNSWGAPGAQGQYTSDARSVDVFAADYDDFTVLFAAGESATGIASPSTAKNVLSIAASTSQRPGSLSEGSVWSASASGYSADGRVKPDLVAPGVDICSTMAEEALNPLGQPCASGSHSSGAPLYGQSNGSSHSTAVAAASVMLTREFLREEAMVSAPSSDLVRATLINGAKDLGTADVPNPDEGWGQIDLEGSLHPHDGSTALTSFYDTNISLNPGFGFIYGFDFDASHGISITLVWTDVQGSSSAAQSAAKLVNDLDLLLIAPDGTTWYGNDFANGVSSLGGGADRLNVVERIELPAGTAVQAGTWSIQVAHRGGTSQRFALVVSADGNHDPATDLTVFEDSIHSSTEEPLVNELLSLRTSWINQAPLATGSYRVRLEDVTAGTILYEKPVQSTAGGQIESSSMYHTFTSTGPHLLRLTVDYNDEVAEINDQNNGINNNIKEFTINVSALGVRLIPLWEDGSEPVGSEQIESASIRTLDARNESQMEFDLILRHEGTGTESIILTAGSLRLLDPEQDGVTSSSPDVWSKSLNISSPLDLNPAGQAGDEVAFTLSLIDQDADPDATIPRYAYSGTYVIDIEARYKLQPLVKHKIRLSLVVLEVDDVEVAIAGTTGLTAEPGAVASFSVSVRNMGNNPATYNVDCQSENRWHIELGDGTSSSQLFEPLGLLQYLPMQVRVRVPEAVDGSPAAGMKDVVDCWVTSLDDDNLNYSFQVEVEVSTLQSFKALLVNPEGEEVGASALAPEISVAASEYYNHSLLITNIGNIELELIVSLQTSATLWPVLLIHQQDSDSSQLEFMLAAGANTSIQISAGVPSTASEGQSNTLVISTYIKGTNKNLGLRNSTILVVQRDVGIDLECTSNMNGSGQSGTLHMEATVGESATMNCTVRNTGNAQLTLVWSSSTVEDWEMGFAGPPTSIAPYAESAVLFMAMAPDGGRLGSFPIILRVTATYGNQSVDDVVNLALWSADSAFITVESLEEDDFNLLQILADEQIVIRLKVSNTGNMAGTWTPSGLLITADGQQADGWEVTCDEMEGLILDAGDSKEINCIVTVQEGANREVLKLRIVMEPSDSEHHIGADDGVTYNASLARSAKNGGLFAGLTTQTTGIILALMAVLILVIGRRLRRVNKELDEGEMLVSPGSHHSADDLGHRRQDALDIGQMTDEVASGSVSSDEIASALAQAVPVLPPIGLAPVAKTSSNVSSLGAGVLPSGLPPLLPKGLPPAVSTASLPTPKKAPPASDFEAPPIPAGGLPAGWTMEQWKHYGAEWLKKQG